MDTDPKPFLEYLDKEMTIMGILSAFSVALASFATERIVTAAAGFLNDIWSKGRPHVIAGAAAAILASFLFYMQRSHRAWYYGQIALAHVRGDASPQPVADWLTDTDGWDTWARYRMAFIALATSFGCYGYAVVEALDTREFVQAPEFWSLYFPLSLVTIASASYWYALAGFPQADRPLKECWRSILKKIRKRR